MAPLNLNALKETIRTLTPEQKRELRNWWDTQEKTESAPLKEDEINQKLFEVPTVLLCSEHTAEHCHRRLVLEYLQDKWGDVNIIHL